MLAQCSQAGKGQKRGCVRGMKDRQDQNRRAVEEAEATEAEMLPLGEDAKLEQVKASSRLLLHVVDAAESNPDAHIEAVNNVLEELGALQRPRLLVFNKVDALEDEITLLGLRAQHPGAVFVSAVTREGLPQLREVISGRFHGDAERR